MVLLFSLAVPQPLLHLPKVPGVFVRVQDFGLPMSSGAPRKARTKGKQLGRTGGLCAKGKR